MTPIKRSQIVAIATTRRTTYCIGSGRPSESETAFTLARAASATRDGSVKTVRLLDFPYDAASKFQAHKVEHMHGVKVLGIPEEHQAAAERLVAGSEASASWPTAAELRGAIVAHDDENTATAAMHAANCAANAKAAPFVDVSTVTEYGLTQKLSNAVRVF